MSCNSESLGELAAALAKAQIALANPEKTLTATIAGERGGAARAFRYAPLSSGLEIIRKTLGQHDLAIVQRTHVDQERRLVVLITVLMHSSGQWITSEWPVCRSDQPLPQYQMGAALTYARRYALFALVGIAGEDDLDAPELVHLAPTSSPAVPVGLNGSKLTDAALPRDRVPPVSDPKALDGESSRDPAERLKTLLKELAGLSSLQAATEWARGTLRQKNLLPADTAAALEQAFAARLREIQTESRRGGSSERSGVADRRVKNGKADQNTVRSAQSPSVRRKRSRAEKIDKSALVLGEPKRLRDRHHLRYVASRPCLVCGRQPADAHHLRFAQIRGLGLKVSDEFAVPLCRGHHREVHRTGDEAAWWTQLKIDALQTAKALWRETRQFSGEASPTGAGP